MAKVFMDVGGFNGDSTLAALDPIFCFEKLYLFEPVKDLAQRIKGSLKDKRLTVLSAGLLDRNEQIEVFAAGTLGGTIFSDAPWINEGDKPITCDFLEATEFFESTFTKGDRIVMKLNCEGSEVAILRNLIESGADRFLSEVLIDFDAKKIPSTSQSVVDIEKLIEGRNFSYHFPHEVQYGMINNYGGIRNWLLETTSTSSSLAIRFKSFKYQFPLIVNSEFNGYYKMRLLEKHPSLRRIHATLRRD